jgi:hypothetical protein
MPCEHGWQRPKRDCLICASPTVPALPEEVDALTFAEDRITDLEAEIATLRAQLAEAQEHFDEFAQERCDECAALDDRILAIEQIAQGLASALDSHGPYLPTDPAHAALRALAAYQQQKAKG